MNAINHATPASASLSEVFTIKKVVIKAECKVIYLQIINNIILVQY